MAANALKAQEIRLDELKADRIQIQLQLTTLERMNEEIDIMEPTDVYNWTIKQEGDYALLRDVLRCVTSFEDAHKILKDETEAAVRKEMEAELQILRQRDKTREAALKFLKEEIEETCDYLCFKEELNQLDLFFDGDITQSGRRGERELELRLDLLTDLQDTLLGQ